MKRIIVCGSRSWSHRSFVEKRLDEVVNGLQGFELITGGCPSGADQMAWDWFVNSEAGKRCGSFTEFRADWDTHGKSAGPRRNREMADYAGKDAICVAFRTKGRSPGTDNMISEARKVGMKVIVYTQEDM